MESDARPFYRVISSVYHIPLRIFDETGALQDIISPYSDGEMTLSIDAQCSERLCSLCGQSRRPQVISSDLNQVWAGVPALEGDVLRGTIVVGPVYTSEVSEHLVADYARAHQLPSQSRAQLFAAFRQTPIYPYVEFARLVAMIYQFLYHKEMDISLLATANLPTEVLGPPIEVQTYRRNRVYDESPVHATYAFEQMIWECIREGKLEKLKKHLQVGTYGNIGPMGHNDPVRQQKNTFIVSVTLATRAAIEGGLSPEIAYSLSDLYIQQVETMKDVLLIMTLNEAMLYDFANRVHHRQHTRHYTKLVNACCDFIDAHVRENLRVSDVAAFTDYSVDYVSRKFREETGGSIGDYIKAVKVSEAKSLLKYSELSLAEISELLSFSSQSFFTVTFKRATGVTPGQYRQGAEPNPLHSYGGNMKITHLKTNRIESPLGFALNHLSFSWMVEDASDPMQTAAQFILAKDPEFEEVFFDSGREEGLRIDSLAYRPDICLAPRTRYYWKVRVWSETDYAESAAAWFETAKMDESWQAQWITPDWEDQAIHPILSKSFTLPTQALNARVYICGLGLYHLELNGDKVGNEHLTPYCNAYDQWLQYQTFDITSQLAEGENRLVVMLGNGWYKGRYCGDGGHHSNVYGDRFALICEVRITLQTGEELVLGSDESWTATRSPVLASEIYDGEVYDARLVGVGDTRGVKSMTMDMNKLQARRSLPVCINEERKPVAVLHTPAGETVLDMGQNMVGWVRFKTQAPAGTEIHLQYGEVLQGGNFYRDNLRSAKAEYTYIADGREAIAQPYFTFYGFRYVKVTGWPGEVNTDDFTGCVVYSKMDIIGDIQTSDEKVNRLFQNALWGQKGNFLDIPTDCPQRDERLGWTGDTQMFSGTACFNMDSSAFFAKFSYDCALEQAKRGGMVPMVVPAVDMQGGGSSAWGDVATILPWNVYEFYGDKAILEQQFESMRSWVDFIKAADDAVGSKRLWTSGFHFGDWLSLDGSDPNSPMGGTPEDFIASAYYYHSTCLVARAAAVLGKTEEAGCYNALAEEIKAAIQQEYFTPTGRLAINTQTGFVLALFMDLAPEEFRARVIHDLIFRLRKDKVHLCTGFVGTPYLCRVLSNHGANDLAYRLFLNEDYPSWLYAVNLGATTIWERWNSLNPDGTISSTGMNSLNHYTYGSIVEWMYRDMCGLNPTSGDDGVTGFRRARIAPKPNLLLQWAKARYRSAAGLYESAWRIGEHGELSFEFTIPFNAEAEVVLPDAALGEISINGQKSAKGTPQGNDLVLQLPAGTYLIAYQPTRPYRKTFSTQMPIVQLVQNEQAKAILAGVFPMIAALDDSMLVAMGEASIRDMANTPYLPMTPEQLDDIDQLLKEIGN